MSLSNATETSPSIWKWSAFAFLSSGIFWISSTVDWTAWSAFELTIAIMTLMELRNLFIESDPKNPFPRRMLWFILFCCLGIVGSQNIHATFTSLNKLIFFFLSYTLFRSNPVSFQTAFRWAVIPICLIGAALIILAPGLFSIIVPHPNLFAGFLTIGGILCLDSALKTESRKQQQAILFGSFWILLGQISTLSLGPTLVSASLMMVRLVLNRKTGSRFWFGLPLIAVALLFLLKHPSAMIARKLEDPYASERVQIWKDSWAQFRSHPWVGTGMGTFRDHYPQFKTMRGIRLAPYAHSEPINILCEIGLIGMALLLWALWPIAQGLFKKSEWTGPWSWIFAAICLQSLVDFSMRYPPIFFAAGFALAQINLNNALQPLSREQKWFAAVLIAAFGIAASLPGIAELFFRSRSKGSDPSKRMEAARIASKIDPFNAYYRFESGRMRDWVVALDLEPRNVWIRRAVARFYFADWERSGNDQSLKEAAKHSLKLLELAPNMVEFKPEIDRIIQEKTKIIKILPNIDNL